MISAIEDALEGHLGGIWTGDVAWFGRPFDPKPNTPYVAASVPARSRQTLGAGSNAIKQWMGTFNAVVAMPASIGKRAANELAWSIATHYRRGTIFPSLPSLQITNTDVRPVYSDTDFLRVPVVVEWFMMET